MTEPGRRSRTLVALLYVMLAILSGLVGAYLSFSGLFPLVFGSRTLIVVVAALLFVGGVVMAVLSPRELSRRQ